MSSGPRAAGKQAYKSGQRKLPQKNRELDKQWGPGWEDVWVAGWKEAEQEHRLKQRRSQEDELER